MIQLTLSNTAIFSLHLLAKQVHQQTGLRCRLSKQQSVLRLLQFCSAHHNTMIRRAFIRFLKELSSRQLQLLIQYGIKLPEKIKQHLMNSQTARSMGHCLMQLKQSLLALFH